MQPYRQAWIFEDCKKQFICVKQMWGESRKPLCNPTIQFVGGFQLCLFILAGSKHLIVFFLSKQIKRLLKKAKNLEIQRLARLSPKKMQLLTCFLSV